MEIKVYKDGSKLKNKIFFGLTTRQFLAMLTIAITAILMMINSFLLHLNEAAFKGFLFFALFTILFLLIFKINGLYGDRWLKLKWNYLKSVKIRTYQTERTIQYDKKEFIQSKKVKETDEITETE